MAEPDPEALGEVAAQDRLLPPPDTRPDPRFYQWAGVSHLFDPATYQDLPPPSIAPNEQGKVPQSDPRVLGGLADLTNVVQNFMPLGGSVAGAAKAAVPLLGSLARGAVREAPAAESALAQGIRAYHSSPYDFDRFDLSKIGTGEGAQVYGHGLYFAENPAVSGQGGQYWNQFLNKFQGPEREVAERLKAANFDRKAAAGDNIDEERAWLEYNAKYANSPEAAAKHTQMLDALRALESGQPVGPRTYEVNIKARPEEMLDWDAPLSKQGRIGEIASQLSDIPLERDPVGATAYRTFGAPQAASAAMKEAGIPGIRYLDQGSRDPAKRLSRTSNYVIFDPNRIDILRKYGMIGAVPAAAGAMGGLARQEQ